MASQMCEVTMKRIEEANKSLVIKKNLIYLQYFILFLHYFIQFYFSFIILLIYILLILIQLIFHVALSRDPAFGWA